MNTTNCKLEMELENLSEISSQLNSKILQIFWFFVRLCLVLSIYLNEFQQDAWARAVNTDSKPSSYQGFTDWLTRKEIISPKMLRELSQPGKGSFQEEWLGLGESECKTFTPQVSEEKRSQSPTQFLQEAFKFEKSGSFCEAAETYMHLRSYHPFAPFWHDAGVRAIIAYLRADDPLSAINEGNELMDASLGSKYHETIYLLLITAVVRRMIANGDDHSQEWTRFLLGIEGSQTDGNTYLSRLSLKSFQEQFPSSAANSLLDEWKQQARDKYASHFFKIGKFQFGEKNYLAAILSYQNILRAGPVTKVFSEAAYESIRSYLRFASEIADRQSIDEAQLREWMRLSETATVDRKQISQSTRAEALKIFKLLEKNLPTDPWTLKAKKLF